MPKYAFFCTLCFFRFHLVRSGRIKIYLLSRFKANALSELAQAAEACTQKRVLAMPQNGLKHIQFAHIYAIYLFSYFSPFFSFLLSMYVTFEHIFCGMENPPQRLNLCTRLLAGLNLFVWFAFHCTPTYKCISGCFCFFFLHSHSFSICRHFFFGSLTIIDVFFSTKLLNNKSQHWFYSRRKNSTSRNDTFV